MENCCSKRAVFPNFPFSLFRPPKKQETKESLPLCTFTAFLLHLLSNKLISAILCEMGCNMSPQKSDFII